MSTSLKQLKSFLVISRYNEDVEWVKDLTSNYIIYNKGSELSSEYNQILCPNFGGNQYDIFRYIHDNYESLPELMAFVQGDPFDHCLPDTFYDLIYNEHFTPLFGDVNYPHGVYLESNTNWYINGSFNNHKPPSKFNSFDELASHLFCDYISQDKLIFPPGSQFIVEKERCLYYSKSFWEKLMQSFCHQIGMNGGREAHIIERMVQIIFENTYNEHN